MKKTFKFEAGHATCVTVYKHKTFIGEAHCHPDDADFESERVGSYIADIRSDIEVLKYMRDYELRPAYNCLNHILCSMKRSKLYNEKSYESKFIRRQLHRIQNQLTAVNNEIATLRLTLKVYIKDKEEFYQKIRKDKNKQ